MNAPATNMTSILAQLGQLAGGTIALNSNPNLNQHNAAIPGLPLDRQSEVADAVEVLEVVTLSMNDVFTDVAKDIASFVDVTETGTSRTAYTASADVKTTPVRTQESDQSPVALISSQLRRLHWQGTVTPSTFSTFLVGQSLSFPSAHLLARTLPATTIAEPNATPVANESNQGHSTLPAPTISTPTTATVSTPRVDDSQTITDTPSLPPVAPNASPHHEETRTAPSPHNNIPQLSTPFGRHVLTVALNDYQSTLFLRELQHRDPHGTTEPSEADTVSTPIPSIPHSDSIPVSLQDGAIMLGARAILPNEAPEAANDNAYAIPYSGVAHRLAPIIHLRRFLETRQPLSEAINTARGAEGFEPTQSATVVALPSSRSTAAAIPAEFPMALYERYGARPSQETLSLYNLARSTRADALQIALDTPYHPTDLNNHRSADFSSALGVQAQSQFQESETPLSAEDAELRATIMSALDEAGFLNEDNSIRPLRDVTEGTILIDLLTRLTPEDHDLFDILEKIELKWNMGFGEWLDVKDINGTLRTYSFWAEREGSKEASLIHPAGGRANIVMQVNDLFDHMPVNEILDFLRINQEGFTAMSKAQSAEDLIKAIPPQSILARLLTEIHYMKIFLKRPRWLERLFGDRGPEYRQNHEDRLRKLNELTESAVIRCLRLLVGMGQKQKRRSA